VGHRAVVALLPKRATLVVTKYATLVSDCWVLTTLAKALWVVDAPKIASACSL
jgi:hypothetical protein